MSRPLKISVLFISIIGFSCNNSDNKMFTLLSDSKTNIKFNNTLFEDGPLNVANYIYFYNGGGVAIGDINNDGLQDILFTGNMVKNRLYINKGNFEFEDITAQSGIADKQGWCTGATMTDVNSDGLLDIYICRSADISAEMRKNLLYINKGNLSFEEQGAKFGLDDIGYSTQAGFFDYDKDGDLDCFINNHSVQKYTAGVQDDPSIKETRDPLYASKLYRNDNGFFNDVSLDAGITSNVLTFGLGMSISDFNKDGWPDVYVSNDFNEQDYYFVNNQKGGFSDQLSKSMDQVSLYSMGNDAADYNNDGQVDLITLDMLPEDNYTQKMHSGAENFDKFQLLFKKGYYFQYSRNMLQKNNGDGTFSEVAQQLNVANTDWSWASLFCDFDNDGYKDLFVSNGYVKDYSDMDFLKFSVDRIIKKESNDVESLRKYVAQMPTNKISNYVLKNENGNNFVKKTEEWGLNQPAFSYGSAYADLDNDGDMDLVVNNSNELSSIYKNNSDPLKNHFLKIKLNGQEKNKSGIGSKISVYSKGKVYYQEQQPVRGFQSSVDPNLNFGVGAVESIDSVLVIWPDDKYQKLTNIKSNQLIDVAYKNALLTWDYNLKNKEVPYFEEVIAPSFVHKENEYNDLAVQSLLPRFYSRSGPCMAKGDLNNDGLEDFYVGGAIGQEGEIYIQTTTGKFIKKPQPSFKNSSENEDTACELFDADNDGDLDLYVGSGGYETNIGINNLQDRLYLNDGKGNYRYSQTSLPNFISSTGVVKASDIDKDGDLDLFVGGRIVPSKYPQTPESKLLLNDGKGTFKDVTKSNAAALQAIGMVTDAVWVDVNNDKVKDLVIVGEWMPIKVFVNQKGKFVDESSNYIKAASFGWWNKILVGDFDKDGDEDLIIANQGTNTQFRSSEKEPVELYFKDFGNSGTINPILCYYINGVSYPAYSRDDMADQMPFIKKIFQDYKSYANAKITDVFTPDQLEGAGILKANIMTSVFLRNNQSKGFEIVPLPQEAQEGPIYAMSSLDVNKDGNLDLVLAGNDFWCRVKFGRYTANHGLLLLGDGKGNFTSKSQKASGFALKNEIRSMLVLKDQLIVGANNDKLRQFRF